MTTSGNNFDQFANTRNVSIFNFHRFDSDDGSDADEYCYMAGKLRSSKSISELCDALTNSSLSERYVK